MVEQSMSFFLYTISVCIILCTIVSILDSIKDWKRMDEIMSREENKREDL